MNDNERPTAADDVREGCQVQLRCPGCGRQGTVAWDKLQRLLRCRGCGTWYVVQRTRLVAVPAPTRIETFEVAVRTGLSDWWTDKARPRGQREPRSSRGARVGWLVDPARPVGSVLRGLAVALVPLAVTLAAWHWSAKATTAEPPLPTSLEGRAPLLAEAWLAGDVPQMLKLTDSSRDRELRHWLAKDRPSLTANEAGHRPVIEVLSIERSTDRAASVAIRIDVPKAGDQRKAILQTQTWTLAGGAWYFQPPRSRSRFR